MIFFLLLCARYCLYQLAWIHEMLHRHCPRAVLSLEQRLALSFILDFPETFDSDSLEINKGCDYWQS